MDKTKNLANESKRLLFANVLYRWARGVFMVFVNIHLWKETGDLQLLAWFNITLVLGQIIWFVWVAKIVKAWFRKMLDRIVFLWTIILYAVMIFIDWAIIDHIYLISTAMWFLVWMYYANYNINQFELTNFWNRGNFEGTKKALKVAGKILFPALIWLIVWFYDIERALYFWIFLLTVSFFIWDVNLTPQVWKTKFRKFIKKVYREKKIMYALLASFFFTIAFSTPLLEILLPLLIYAETQSDIQLWFSLSGLSIWSIALMYIFWKFINYNHYATSLKIFCWCFIISVLGLLFTTQYSLILAFSALITASLTLYSIPYAVITTNSLHSIKNYQNYTVEFNTLKEIAQVCGWVVSFTTMYLATDLTKQGIGVIFFTMIVMSVITTIFLINVKMSKIK